jgi:hypothetical protein
MSHYISALRGTWLWVAAGTAAGYLACPFAALAVERKVDWSISETGSRPSGSHAEFSVSLEPISIQRHGSDGEELELVSEIDTALEKPMRSMVSVRIADDRGLEIVPKAVSPMISLEAKSRTSGGHFRVPPLPDGWYQVIASAVFAEDSNRKELRGSETASLYLHVEQGAINIVDPDEWYANSNSGEGWNAP